MSLFEDLAGAKTQGRGAKITEPALGQSLSYIVRIDDIKLQRSNRSMGTMFIPEFTILRGTEQTPAGCERSWVQFPEHRKLTDPGNIKLFVAACLGMTDSEPEVPADAFRRATEGAFNGTVLELTVEHVKTQADRDFFVHSWRPFRGDKKALLEALPTAPPLPEAPSTELTREAWMAGRGPAAVHPSNDRYEWNPQHPDWGTRPRQ